MMETERETLWSQVIEQVVDGSASPDHAGGILNHATIDHIDDSSIILSFPTALMKNGADRSYIEKIQDALYGITGKDMSVTTIIDTSLPLMTTQPVPVNDIGYQHPETSSLSTVIKMKPLEKTAFPLSSPGNRSRQGSNSYARKFTFETFVMGESNKLAYTSAVKIAELPGDTYNPLFIYGRSGLGKTHLLCAIDNYVSGTRPELKICYCQAKDLLEDIIGMARSKNWKLFDTKYSSADVLLIDDVQYLENKPESTERVFQLLQKFQMERKQIVISADRSPKEIDMDERITSRFMSGLMVDVQPPTFEMKLGIIKNFKDRELSDIPLQDEVLTYVAEISSSNIREIEGALSTLGIRYSIGQEITVDTAQEILKNYFPNTETKKITIAMIQHEVERYYNITHEEIICSKRERRLNVPRQVAMYLCRELTDESYPTIGRKFGGRDHSTVMNSVRQVENKMKESREYFDSVEKVRQNLKEKA